jgi:hypothetical protein
VKRLTGRELIIYIMQNGLEDEVVIKNGILVSLINKEEVAVKFGVGVATVEAWYTLNMIEGYRINGSLYFRKDIDDPRKTNKER